MSKKKNRLVTTPERLHSPNWLSCMNFTPTEQRSVVTCDTTQQADLFSARSAYWLKRSKIQSDWQKCLDFAYWLEVMEHISIDCLQGGAFTSDHFAAIENANRVLSEAMLWVTAEAQQLQPQ